MATPPYDVIVVLGTRVLADGRPSPALARRLAHGVRLFRDGRGAWLVLSGGAAGGRPAEAEIMRDLALAAGVPEDRVVLEPASANTFENVLNTAEIMRRRGWSRALVVSDGYHLRRALAVFRRLPVSAEASAAPRTPRDRLSYEAAVRAREIAARLWYLYRIRVRDRRRIAHMTSQRGTSRP
ncbi:MAG: YdcF family protein [Alphaproteobacteria bacterium]|nr:YdcF family protein [Alphaproteobacteria bacterium]